MTTLQQALHIFRKDARHLRIEIAGVLLLTFFLVLTGVQTWDQVQERGGTRDFDGPFTVLLPLAWCLLIARVVQVEALPGDRHFWLTRPYSRTGLVLSKLLFIGAFISLPFMMAQAAIVAFSGLPVFSHLSGLLWNQLLVSAILLLPAAAVASLTRNLAQFLPAAVLTTGLVMIPVAEHRTSWDLEWIRTTVGLSLAVLITSLVVWRQYRLRRAGNTAMHGLAAAVVAMIVFLAFPDSAAIAIQSSVVGSPDGQFALKLGTPQPSDAAKKITTRYGLLELPIAVTGEDPANLHLEATAIRFKTLSGATRRSSSRVSLTDAGLVQATFLGNDFIDRTKKAPVSLETEYLVTQFGNARSVDVPLDGTPVYIPELGQCGATADYDRRTFVCRSAFRPSESFRSDRIGKRESGDRWWDAYSPFPAQVQLYPIFSQTFRLVGDGANEIAPAAPERPAKLEVRKRVAYFRYALEANNVRLADFAAAPKEDAADGTATQNAKSQQSGSLTKGGQLDQ
jgi:hypothetical protein